MCAAPVTLHNPIHFRQIATECPPKTTVSYSPRPGPPPGTSRFRLRRDFGANTVSYYGPCQKMYFNNIYKSNN